MDDINRAAVKEDYFKAMDIMLEFLDDIFAHAIDRRDPQLEELAKSYRRDFKYLSSKKHSPNKGALNAK